LNKTPNNINTSGYLLFASVYWFRIY